jgi:hypothetical protein
MHTIMLIEFLNLIQLILINNMLQEL